MDPSATCDTLKAGDDPEPRKPTEPDPLDCCGSGCVRCIFDVHDEAMERYRDRHAAWLARRISQQPKSDKA